MFNGLTSSETRGEFGRSGQKPLAVAASSSPRESESALAVKVDFAGGAKSSETETRLPFLRPTLVGNELAYVKDAIDRGHISGAGAWTSRCEELLSREMNGAHVLLTTSCTHALEMAALLLDIHDGDEVIVPSFAFPSTANAFALRGARIVFGDVTSPTLNFDPKLLPALVTSRTKAIVVLHYGGIAANMDPILAFAERAGIAVVEDNAHGLFGRFRSQPLGTFGMMSTLSFHETKNIFCGEGGALVINDSRLIARAEIVREKGTDRARFFRGEIDKYRWRDLGSSYVMSEMLAAFLFAQLERRRFIQHVRRRLWARYCLELNDWALNRNAQLPTIPAHCQPAYHLLYLLMTSAAERDALITHLGSRGIQALFHYSPLHLSPMGEKFGAQPEDCPIATSVSERIVRLPLFTSMTAAEQTRVIQAIRTF